MRKSEILDLRWREIRNGQIYLFRDLRHTFASHQKMAGTDDYTLMAIMGRSEC